MAPGTQQGVHDDPDHEHPQHVADVVVSRNPLLEKVLEGVDGADINHRHEPHENAQAGVTKQDEPVRWQVPVAATTGITKDG